MEAAQKISRDQAGLLLALLEIAIEGNWSYVAQAITERGYTPEEVVAATNALCDVGGIDFDKETERIIKEELVPTEKEMETIKFSREEPV